MRAGVLFSLLACTYAFAQPAIRVNLPVGHVAAASRLAHGYNCAFFERGLCDALNDPATGRALADTLRTMGVTGLRFPGGSFTYWYPHLRSGLAAFKAAGFAEASYNMWWPEKFGWASESSFFAFCRQAGITAWYEVNPGHFYDAKADRVRQIAPMKRAKPMHAVAYDSGAYLPLALEHVRQLVTGCRQTGVDVVWEIGNEYYVYFDPEEYAHTSAAFIKAIREADPSARVAVCGDCESWSTRDWQKRMLPALRKAGVERLEFASVHCYLQGVGEWREGQWHPFPRDTGEQLFTASARAWPLIRGMYDEFRQILATNGYPATKLAFTEFNVVYPSKDWNAKLEHSLGRALGEAAMYPNLAAYSGAVFFHDLVRSGPGEGNWFQRLDYHPESPPDQRYRLQMDAQVMRMVSRHARGRILYDSGDGVCVSCTDSDLYITIASPKGSARTVALAVPPTACRRDKCEGETLSCSSLEATEYDYRLTKSAFTSPAAVPLTLTAPPYSFVACRFPLVR